MLQQFFASLKTLNKNFAWDQLTKKQVIFSIFVLFCFLNIATPASAHHVIDGRIPANFIEGLLSGFGHPIIGLDHFVGVIATGLIGVGQSLGIIFPISFILATIGGTIFHLNSINLPFPEVIIPSSIVIFGLILTLEKSLFNNSQKRIFAFVILGAIAGIFHGYAYGESIIGAQMNPLFAYLIGFTLIQLVIAIGSYKIGNLIIKTFERQFYKIIPLVGLAISSVGFIFMFS